MVPETRKSLLPNSVCGLFGGCGRFNHRLSLSLNLTYHLLPPLLMVNFGFWSTPSQPLDMK